MTREEQLTEVKKSLNVTGTALDDTLGGYLDEVKLYMVNAGVNALVVNTTEAIGCICRGVADLYINNELSQYFYQRVSQLAMAIVVTPDPTPAVTIVGGHININGAGITKNIVLNMSDESEIVLQTANIPALTVTATDVTWDNLITTVTVTPAKAEGNKYLITNQSGSPAYGEDMTGARNWSEWDGMSPFDCQGNENIRVAECTADNIAVKSGSCIVRIL